MKKIIVLAVVCMMAAANFASADTFGTGDNQFIIDFVPISGSTNPTSGISTGNSFSFTGVNHDYRMGAYEITNDQWNKFKSAYGAVTGSPSHAYLLAPYFTGTDVPTNRTSWYEAAQFVNWLNTSTGHQAAYKFTGTQGTSNYTFTLWTVTDTGYDAGNPYRNSDTFYFLPTENEWVKAAYWNGTSLQTYSNASAGDLVSSGSPDPTKWNCRSSEPWNATSGVKELNGTYNMMGNVFEWMESPYYSGDYLSGSARCLRGGSNDSAGFYLSSKTRNFSSAHYENFGTGLGFRVASVPEPCSLVLLFLGGLVLRSRK